jgi:hypothetical protein
VADHRSVHWDKWTNVSKVCMGNVTSPVLNFWSVVLLLWLVETFLVVRPQALQCLEVNEVQRSLKANGLCVLAVLFLQLF